MILVADNNKDIRGRIANLLKQHGFTAEETKADAELEHIITQKKPELVIGGLVLQKDSDEFRIFQSMIQRKKFKNTKLLLTLDSASPEKSGIRKKQIEQIQCDSFCDKPIDTVELIDKVRTLLSGTA